MRRILQNVCLSLGCPSDSPDHPGSILYYSKSSDIPYSQDKPVTGQAPFFAVSYSKPALEISDCSQSQQMIMVNISRI